MSRRTPRVEVAPAVLAWALERSGREDALRRRFPIDAWLAGSRQPTLRQLEALSRATLVPLGCFFLDTPPNDDDALHGISMCHPERLLIEELRHADG